MSVPPGSVVRKAPGTIRFGVFEFDARASELRKRGLRIHLLGQPTRILAMLLERPGELVTREDIRKALWPADTFVNFEHSLNAAVKRLRRALGDSPDNPRFVETLPRRGYRFIAPVDRAGAAAAEPRPSHVIDSLAVLPFENAAADPETEYLSDGITESLINSLSQLSGIRVMARSTVFRYKGRETDPRSIGRKLNVEAVLTGRVLLRGEALVIGAELVEVQGGWRLWGEQYNRRLAEILSVEEEISREISTKLRLRLSGEDRSRLAKHYTRDTEAYRDYLKGRYFHAKMTEDGLRESIVFFQRALEKDPGYALAYIGMADAYGLMTYFGLLPPLEAMPRAKEAAQRALALDESLPEAHAAIAHIREFYEWDWQAAESGYRRALLLNPNNADTHRFYATLLSAQGRSEEALREILRARELDPLSLVICMEVAWHCYMARDYTRALEHAIGTLELEPAFASARHIVGLVYEQQGRVEAALAEFEKAHAGSGGNPATLASMGRILAAAGRPVEVRALLRQLDEIAARAYVPPYYGALIHAGLGNADEALSYLEASWRRHDLWLVWLGRDPRFDVLRSQPRFQRLLQVIGLGPSQPA
jgi:TolB-like protein/Tfp pilus assembly protein PilF